MLFASKAKSIHFSFIEFVLCPSSKKEYWALTVSAARATVELQFNFPYLILFL